MALKDLTRFLIAALADPVSNLGANFGQVLALGAGTAPGSV